MYRFRITIEFGKVEKQDIPEPHQPLDSVTERVETPTYRPGFEPEVPDRR